MHIETKGWGHELLKILFDLFVDGAMLGCCTAGAAANAVPQKTL